MTFGLDGVSDALAGSLSSASERTVVGTPLG
jgi:hypothetical protein